MLVPEFLPGERCQVNIGTASRHAEIRFVGPLNGMKGFWIGVQYDDKVGKNDGQHNGRRYFRCPPGHGGFVRATKIASKGGAPLMLEEGGDAASGCGSPQECTTRDLMPAYSEKDLIVWHRDVAPTRAEDCATPDRTTATGPGLEKAVVGSLAQFTIVMYDKNGQRVKKGGDEVAVVIRGRSAAGHSQPALMRTKLIDRADGTVG